MHHLPARFAAVILTFAPVFLQQRTWRHAELLLIGAILAPGKRTVTSLLRITGLSRERRFTSYHRALNRAIWDPHAAARLLLGLLLGALVLSTALNFYFLQQQTSQAISYELEAGLPASVTEVELLEARAQLARCQGRAVAGDSLPNNPPTQHPVGMQLTR